MAADGHKWLLGPEGAGLFFIRREHLDRLRPLGIGWSSVVRSYDFSTIDLTLKPSAARYEGGSMNSAGLIALGASLDLLAGIGLSAIGQRVLDIAKLTCQRLEEVGAVVVSPREDACRSGIVACELPGASRSPCENTACIAAWRSAIEAAGCG